jgi:hypothetical protein
MNEIPKWQSDQLMQDKFQDNINIEKFIAFELRADVEQRRVENRFSVLYQKIFDAGNELADVAVDCGRPLFLGFSSTLQEILQTSTKGRSAVFAQLKNQYLVE